MSSNTDTWLPLMKPHPRMSSMQPADRVVRWGVSSQSCWGPEFRVQDTSRKWTCICQATYSQQCSMPASGALSSQEPMTTCIYLAKDRADLSSSAEAIGLQQASRIRGEQQTPAQQGSPLPSSSMPLPGISKGLRQRLAARSGWLVCTPESMTQTAVVLVPVSSCRAPPVVTEAVSQLRRAAANTRHAAQQHRKAVLGSKRCTIIPASICPPQVDN